MAARSKAARKTAGKAGKAAVQARQNAYVQRFIEDEELRENVRSALDSARKAYRRMQNGKGPARALVEDRKLQKNLRQTADSLKQAGDQGGPALGCVQRPRRLGADLSGQVGLAAHIRKVCADQVELAREWLQQVARKAVLDRIFGAEEEFEYSSTTAPHAAVPS